MRHAREEACEDVARPCAVPRDARELRVNDLAVLVGQHHRVWHGIARILDIVDGLQCERNEFVGVKARPGDGEVLTRERVAVRFQEQAEVEIFRAIAAELVLVRRGVAGDVLAVQLVAARKVQREVIFPLREQIGQIDGVAVRVGLRRPRVLHQLIVLAVEPCGDCPCVVGRLVLALPREVQRSGLEIRLCREARERCDVRRDLG